MPTDYQHPDPANIEFDFDLAAMALKGRRFTEAQERFTALTRLTNNSDAWCGLGYAKLASLFEDVTVDEVFYCFEKAKSVSTDEVNEVETVVLQATDKVAHSLYRLYGKASLQARKGAKESLQEQIGSIVGSVFSMQQDGENKPINSLIKAGNTAFNYDKYLKVTDTTEQAATIAEMALSKCNELRAAVRDLVTNLTAEAASLEQNLDTYFESIKAAIQPPEEKPALTAREQEQAEAAAALQAIGNPDHPFHALKKEALSDFRKNKTVNSFGTIVSALKIYPQDEDLLVAKRKLANRLFWKELAIFLLPVMLIPLAICTLLNWNDHIIWFPFIFLLFIIVLMVRWALKRKKVNAGK